MAVQLYVYDDLGTRYEVDLYAEEPIKITLSSESLKEIPTIDSAFSRQFRVPATQNNSKVFKWWYEVNTVDFDVTKKIKSEIHVDGILYKTGHTRINAAYLNGDTTQVDLELVFFGETKDFSTQVGEGFLTTLDLAFLNHKLTTDNVLKSWLPLTDPNVLVGGGFRWIVADRGYTYDDSGNALVAIENLIAGTDVGNYNKTFTQNAGDAIELGQLTPMIQVKALIDAMFANTDYTYSADSVFNEDWFKDLYTDGLPEALPVTPMTNGDFEVGPVVPPSFGNLPTPVPWRNTILDNANAMTPNGIYYVSPTNGTINFNVDMDWGIPRYVGLPTPTITTRLKKNGITVKTDTFTTPPGVIPYLYTLSYTQAVTVVEGDKIWVEVQFSASGGPNQLYPSSRFSASGVALTISAANLVKRDIKSIDFLKSILTKFRLVMTPSTTNEREFVVQPFLEYVASGQRLDWTDKLDNSKDVVLQPVFYDQAQRINFTDVEDIDKMNQYHQDEFDRVYGQLFFDSENELLLETREIKTIFAPTPVNQMEGVLPTSNFIIPFFTKHGSEVADHGHLIHEPMTPKPRLLFWNGTPTVAGTEYWWMAGPNDAGVQTTVENQVYPRMSYLSAIPSVSDTLNLNWFRDIPYFEASGGPAGQLGESVYERYWNVYIQSLYSPLARKLTAYFTIDAQDLRNLSFDDLIFISNAYWRVVKVYDAPLTDISTVKVDLVKILDAQLISNGGTPTETGGGIDPVDVTGGGGSPLPDPSPVTRLYRLQTCVNPGDYVYAYYQSVSALTPGQSVTCSGVIHAGICYEVIQEDTVAPTTAILEVYADCIECQNA